jgi:hypothetical protein
MSRIEGKLLKRNYEFFKMRTLLHVQKYFQKVRGLFRNCRWALWVSSVKQAKWNCKARTEFKLPAFLHFVSCEGPMTALMLRGTIMRPLCSWYLQWGSGAEMMSVVTSHKRWKYNPGCFYNRRKICIFIGSLISWW